MARSGGPWRLRAVLAALLLAGPLTLAVAVPAQADQLHWCGSSCTGKDPRAWVHLLDGTLVRCSDSARNVSGPWTPYDRYGNRESSMKLYHVYSPVCQTTWASATNTKALGRKDCVIYEVRTVGDRIMAQAPCPGVGTSAWTAMVDDHDVLNHGELYEEIPAAGVWLSARTNDY